MNKKTRIFLVASALTLSVGLCTGLLAYYGGLPTMASTRGAGPEELKFVPADAAVVAYANVREVMASEFRQTLRQIVPDADQHGQEQFEKETGIKVEQDIDSVTACMWANATGNGGDDHSGFVMLRGRFDTGRLEAKAREHKGVQIEDFHGARLLRLTHEGPDRVEMGEDGQPRDPKTRHQRKTVVLAFVEPGLLMFGEEAAVKRALSKSAPSIQSSEELMGMIAEVEGDANLWAVGRVEALAKNAQLPEQIASQIPQVKWFSASSRINGGLSGQLRAEARDDEAAKNLREVVQGFLALAKMQAGNKPEMQSLMQSIQLSGSGTTVALSFQVPSEFINAMASKHAKPVE
jgi:hypothetical protein